MLLADDTSTQSYFTSHHTSLGNGFHRVRYTFQLLPHVYIRLFGFGAAEFAVPGTKIHFSGSLSGTLDNSSSAPETITSQERGFPADIWGVGCALIEMFTGRARLFGKASTTMFDRLAMMEKLCGGTVGLDQLNSTQRDASLEEAARRWAQVEMNTLEVRSSPPTPVH
jgi:hypothetical protein